MEARVLYSHFQEHCWSGIQAKRLKPFQGETKSKCMEISRYINTHPPSSMSALRRRGIHTLLYFTLLHYKLNSYNTTYLTLHMIPIYSVVRAGEKKRRWFLQLDAVGSFSFGPASGPELGLECRGEAWSSIPLIGLVGTRYE